MQRLIILLIFLLACRPLFSQAPTPGSISPTYQLTNIYTGPPKYITSTKASLSTCTNDTCFSYQWQQSTNNTVWQDIIGSKSLSYNPGNYYPTEKTSYRLKVTAKSTGATAYSAISVIDTQRSAINGPVDCWQGQTSTYYYTQGNSSTYSWSATVGSAQIIGGYESVGSFTVKWTRTGTHTIALNNNGDFLYLKVYVHNDPLFAGCIDKRYQAIEKGNSISIYPGNAVGGNCTGSFSYQWQESSDSINYPNINGQTSSSLTITPTQNKYYRRQVVCGSTIAYSDTTYISLYPYFNPGTITPGSADSIPWNSMPPTITGTVPVGGNDTSYSYQWEFSRDGSNYQPVTKQGQGINYQSKDTLTVNTYYKRRVTNGTTTRYSNSVLVLVKKVLFDPGIISPYTVVVNSGTSPALTGTPATGGTVANYFYQWQQSYDETNWKNCSGGTAPSFTPLSVIRTTYYRRLVTNGGHSDFSNVSGFFNVIKVKVAPGATGTNAPNAVSQATADPSVSAVPVNGYTLANITTSKINSVTTWEIEKPGVTTVAAVKALTSNNDYNQSTTYMDDLGREIQTVNKQGTPNNYDLISVVNYDVLGRVVQKYLPYTDNGATGNFRTNAPTSQTAFYNSFFNNKEGFYYSNTGYEASPLNRVLKQTEPGNSWTGNAVGTRTDYTFNTSLDSIKIWSIGTNISDTPKVTGSFAAGSLVLIATTDEHENKVLEYKDKDGKVLLKKVQLSDTVYNGYLGWLSTYYIYDVFDRLRVVISPKAVRFAINNSWTLNSTIRNELCFQYNYDEKGRMISKKVPGAGTVYMVYDNRDRLVFTQDANMYAKSPTQWAYTLYDDINRPVETGIMTYTGTWDNLRTNMARLSDGNTTSNTGGSYASGEGDMFLSIREPERLSYQASNSITLQAGFRSEDNASFIAEIVPDSKTGFTNTPVSVNTNPIPAGATLYPLTYTFYDNYTWTTKNYSTSNNTNIDDGGNINAEALPFSMNESVAGMITGTRVRLIEDPNNLSVGKWMESVSFYDEKGRVIQTNSDNYKGGTDVVTNRYDFTGKIVSNYVVHNNLSGNITDFNVRTSMLYDHAGRLLKVTKQIIQNNKTAIRTIAQNLYDDLGQLKNKQIGQKPSGDGTFTGMLENQDYSYNIRGWLKGINWSYTAGTNKTQANKTQAQLADDKWFAMDLSYDWGFQNNYAPANQLNGNISGVRWVGDGDGEERAYGFSYDKANRLMRGDFTRNLSNVWTKDAVSNFDIAMGDGSNPGSAYDENGNILKMQQNGMKFTSNGPQSTLIDNMSYSYKNAGEVSNKLKAVTEATTTAADNRLGDFTDNNTTGDDYDYDPNGNLIVDKNKRISLIEYNHLNLPWRITVVDASNNTKGKITFIYDATGNKLEKRTDESPSSANGNTPKVTKTSYLGGFVYEDNKLQFFCHEEGRVRPIIATTDNGNQSFAFDYFLKDHLGNVRTVLTDEVQNEYAIATMEEAYKAVENQLYYNIDNCKYPVTSIANYPADATTNHNAYVARLNGSEPGKKIGPSRVTKVMTGDKLTVSVKSFYKQATTSTDAHQAWKAIADQLISTLFSTAAPAAVAGKGAATDIANTTFGSPSGYDAFFNNQNNSATNNPLNKPKAYLNILLFDENFKLDQQNSRVRYACGSGGVLNVVSEIDLPVKKNGYAYIYVSNESSENVDVFFDNLTVQQKHGPLLEENHYYPFGLTIAGISSKAAGGIQNRDKFNGGNELQSGEFSDGSGLETYDAVHRMYDPQLGRFHQIDEFGEVNDEVSSYSFAHNNPIVFNDPLGLIDGFPGEKPAELGEVVVKSYTKNQRQQIYWDLRNSNTSFDRVANKPLRDWLKNHDNVQRHMDRVHQMTREQDMIVLEAATWLIPETKILKLLKLKKLVALYKLKRGKAAVTASKIAVKTTEKGVSVLGKMDDYIRVADEVGAKRFSIPPEIWKKMDDVERWAANTKFLDRMIARGDEVVLSNSAYKAEAGSVFAKEIEYMVGKGYSIAEDGMSLIK